ncbi:hypothetical protein G3M83_18225 [Rouxiella badensis]|uniref:hypothetical protein n=1 Tax=Rouxiella badensis TaxID=1646377 RepID=UPI0013EF03FA|nr:hypothetical protein [Rouxiella badensis]QII39489.1 hypothetical protein G3M83_18225 [Rouxiella badensis]
MFLPSKAIVPYIESENIGFWFDYDFYTKTVGIMAKLPSSIIKSVLVGAKVEIHFSFTMVKTIHLAIGMTIHDSDDDPAVYVSTVRDKKEVKGLRKLINNEQEFVTVTFFNEFTHPVVWGDIEFDTAFISRLKKSVNNGFSTTKTLGNSNDVSDSFYKVLVPGFECVASYETQVISALLSISSIKSILSSVKVPQLSEISYDLSKGENGSEGYVQEEMVAHILSYLFGGSVMKSPQVNYGEKVRELTDVIAIDENNILLVESKTSSIIEKGRLVSSERAKNGVNGLLKKAISQINGVAKMCVKGIEVYEANKRFSFNATNNIHILIVVSELNYSDPERKFNKLTNDIYDRTGCKVHVMDIMALSNFVKISRLIKPLFWMNLESRFKCSYENLTYNIKDIDSSLPIW